MTRLLRSTLWGAAAGAAGTTTLNAVTYLDVVGRARPESSTPKDTVEAIAKDVDVTIPGDEDERDNRLGGLGALTGIAVGVGVGALLGAARALGWRPGGFGTTVVATAIAFAGTNGPMTVLGVTDPRTWKAQDWISDIVPHVAYGVVTAAVVMRSVNAGR